MNKALHPIYAAAALLAAILPTAIAIPMTYEIGAGSKIDSNSNDPGLVVKTSPVKGLEKVAFTLENNQSYTFDFFNIWTDESSVNKGEDTAPADIKATLDFDIPDEAFSLNGQTLGVWGILLQSGQVKWNGPATFTAGSRTFSITLSNEKFSEGFFGLDQSVTKWAVVEATIKQISSSTVSVPDKGSTAMLLGLAFLSLGFIRRRNATV